MNEHVDRTEATPPTRAAQRTRRRGVYAVMVVMTIAVALVSLLISAPAWWPGHARLTMSHDYHQRGEQTRTLRERQQARLEGYAWRDREAGLVTIPIDRAMTLWIKESRQRQEEAAR
ncbi:MAG: hypothetical protein WD042_18750 [Phycisphaeraceae bacterium]